MSVDLIRHHSTANGIIQAANQARPSIKITCIYLPGKVQCLDMTWCEIEFQGHQEEHMPAATSWHCLCSTATDISHTRTYYSAEVLERIYVNFQWRTQMCMHVFCFVLGGKLHPTPTYKEKRAREVYALRFVHTSSYSHWLLRLAYKRSAFAWFQNIYLRWTFQSMFICSQFIWWGSSKLHYCLLSTLSFKYPLVSIKISRDCSCNYFTKLQNWARVLFSWGYI